MKLLQPTYSAIAVMALITTATCLPASAEIFGQYGAVTTVTPGPGTDPAGFQLTSDTAGLGYAGLFWTAQSATPLSAITQLTGDYQMTMGTFGGGAPRFTIFDTTNNNNNAAYVYWGTPLMGGTFSDPAAGSASNTGNYADLGSADLRVQVNGFGGDGANPNTYETWAAFVAADGATDVGFVSLDLDGGFTGTQQALVDNFTVNTDVDSAPTPEPITFVLLGGGLILVAAVRRRDRSVAVSKG